MKLLFWEIWSYAQVPFFWYVFRRFAKREIAGDIVAGTLFGLFNEFATEPLWNYHFRLTFYKDIPVSVPLGWGAMMALVVFASERLCRKLLGREADPADPRLLACDVFAGILIGFPLETIGMRAGIWDYNLGLLGWSWGEIPFVHMPYEALLGYCLVMLIAPSFVRHWRARLSPLRD